MAATAPSELTAETACFECLGLLQMAQRLRIALEIRALLAVDPAADVTPAALLSYGACYACLGMTRADAVELAILDQISQAL